MNLIGDLTPGKTIVCRFNTHKADGTPITLAGTPACSVYKNSTTESTAGVSLTVDYDSRTGLHSVVVDTSADGTFYAAGNDFDIVITTGTVDSISVVGTVVGTFSLSNRSALRPATADRTLGVDTNGGTLIQAGTGTGQLDFTSGVVKGNLVQILATALTETVGGYLAAAFKKVFDVASAVFTAASVNQTGDSFAIVNSGSYGNSALLTAIQNVQNGTFISTTIPQVLERPDSSSASVSISVVICDETGAPKNLDSGNPTVTLVNDAGTDLSSRLGAWTNPATGKYVIVYTNTSTDTIEGLHWDITGTVNSKSRRYVAYMQIVDTTAVSFTSTDRTNLGTILTQTAASSIRGSVGLGVANLDTQLNSIYTVAGLVQAKTDNLPADPASRTNITAASGIALAANQHVIVDSGTVTTLTNAPADSSGVTTLLGRLTSARSGYLDALNIAGPVASHADILAINQSSSKHILLQTVGQYERPETGNTVYTVEARTFAASDGSAVNADSTPTFTATGQTSGSLAANLGTVTNPATGVYRVTYTVASTATTEPIRFDVSATINTSTFTLSAYTQVVDEVSATWTITDASHLTAIYNKLPTNNIADETLVLAAVGTPMQTTSDLSATAKTSVQTAAQAAMTSQGYTTVRAGYLDVLNGLPNAIATVLFVDGSTNKLKVNTDHSVNADATVDTDAIATALAAALAAGGTTVITVPTPVVGSVATIYKGSDYLSADSLELTFTLSGAWPSFAGGNVQFKLNQGFTKAGTIVTATGSTRSITVELTADETNRFVLGDQGYSVIVTLASGHVMPPVQGTARIKAQ